MIFYENVWKSGELSTGWGLEVRSREVYVNIPNHSFELSRVLPLSISILMGGNGIRSKSVSNMGWILKNITTEH